MDGTLQIGGREHDLFAAPARTDGDLVPIFRRSVEEHGILFLRTERRAAAALMKPDTDGALPCSTARRMETTCSSGRLTAIF